MFNQITRRIQNPSNDVQTFVKVSLPAIESEDTEGNYKVIADPNLSAQSILDTLVEHWDNAYLCNNMFTRFIAVICDNKIRTTLAEYAKANPNATQEEIDEEMQKFVDAGWNKNLKHPVTDRKAMSVEKKREKSEQFITEMSTDAQIAFVEKLKANNPELAKMLK